MERYAVTTPPGILLTGTLAATAVVTGLSSTAGILPGQFVYGTGIPGSALVMSVDSATQVTLSVAATASGSASLRFLVEPISLDEAKRQLRQDDTYDDVQIAGLITSARLMCETQLNQTIMAEGVTLYLDQYPWGGGYFNRAIRQMGPTSPYWLPSSTFPIELPGVPVTGITSVTYYDYQNVLQTVDPSLYVFETGTPASVSPVFGKVWPIAQPRISAIQIAYTVGYGSSAAAIPENIKQAMKLHVYQQFNISSPDVTDRIRSLLATSDHGAYG